MMTPPPFFRRSPRRTARPAGANRRIQSLIRAPAAHSASLVSSSPAPRPSPTLLTNTRLQPAKRVDGGRHGALAHGQRGPDFMWSSERRQRSRARRTLSAARASCSAPRAVNTTRAPSTASAFALAEAEPAARPGDQCHPCPEGPRSIRRQGVAQASAAGGEPSQVNTARVEGVGPFEIRQVARFRQDDERRAGDACRQSAGVVDRRDDAFVTDDEECGDRDRRQLRGRVRPIAQPLHRARDACRARWLR